MKLTDIIPVEKWRELEEDIFQRSGLASNVFNVEGIRITDYKVWVNRLCPAVKADDRGQSFICAVAHMNIASMARQSREAVIGECDAGLLKLVVPIFVKGEFLGAFGACGLLVDDNEVDAFMINRTIEMDEDKIEELSSDIKQLEISQVESLRDYISGLVYNEVTKYEQNNS